MRDTFVLIVVASWLTAGLLTGCNRQSGSAKPQTVALAAAAGPMCEPGITTPKRMEAPADADAGAQAASNWIPKINDRKPPRPVRAATGMTWIPGGSYWMGSEEANMPDAKPLHRVYVDGFWMHKTEVTNEQFSRFVKSTGYVTVAERKPRAGDFPTAPPENLVAGSVVFSPPAQAVPLDNHFLWWSYVPRADWRHPEGPQSGIKDRMNHPVVHMAYRDAAAYCAWSDARLPTEAEFEFAARGGLDRKRYDWGDEFEPSGKHMANTFQGHFPDHNTAEDGYATTAPVASFPANGYGLYDISGNVWEWTSDWYRPDYYPTLAANGEVAMNPQGPQSSLDPSEPGVAKRVQRGGSFLCTDQYCSRYVPGGRGKGDPDTGTNHLGFRCVR